MILWFYTTNACTYVCRLFECVVKVAIFSITFSYSLTPDKINKTKLKMAKFFHDKLSCFMVSIFSQI